MRSDIDGLEIRSHELGDLANIPFTSNLKIGLILSITFSSLIFIIAFLLNNNIGVLFMGLISLIILIYQVYIAIRLIIFKSSPIARRLLKDVKKFNLLIQAIHVNDQLEQAGNLNVKLKERARVIKALRLTRQDLCRALTTEKIFRENKKIIAHSPSLFENNLLALSTLQLDDKAGEHGYLLNEAMQISLSTQEELKKLQDK